MWIVTTNLGKEASSCEETHQHPEVKDVLHSNGPERSTAACKGHTYQEREKKDKMFKQRITEGELEGCFSCLMDPLGSFLDLCLWLRNACSRVDGRSPSRENTGKKKRLVLLASAVALCRDVTYSPCYIRKVRRSRSSRLKYKRRSWKTPDAILYFSTEICEYICLFCFFFKITLLTLQISAWLVYWSCRQWGDFSIYSVFIKIYFIKWALNLLKWCWLNLNSFDVPPP